MFLEHQGQHLLDGVVIHFPVLLVDLGDLQDQNYVGLFGLRVFQNILLQRCQSLTHVHHVFQQKGGYVLQVGTQELRESFDRDLKHVRHK